MTIANRVWNPNSIPSMFSEHIEQEPHAAPAHIQLERAQRFHETFAQKLQRMARAIWHTSAQLPLSTSLRVIDDVMRDKTVGVATAFDPNHALAEPDGFCAILEDVSSVTLLTRLPESHRSHPVPLKHGWGQMQLQHQQFYRA